ncbi:uncharacterized protein K444DRAFT_608232 [Hyaloscypha bicolor E]|uniref:Uncharacterized protein n=1 Tax=Hyaloscypha bicolor E TaxID=1095630 RepID=A0A2J6TRL1_9HELO|nr:uncharacterized protein K444DRAFT_608232 [Hyaloscypha bicolor E]PMD65660.1 hypothetical protein K444DRAFT_608232 [Hyaloscypha bicolor E]
MSRHKLVKNLDLDDELDDFDGGGNYDDGAGGEELSEEDQGLPLIPTPPSSSPAIVPDCSWSPRIGNGG